MKSGIVDLTSGAHADGSVLVTDYGIVEIPSEMLTKFRGARWTKGGRPDARTRAGKDIAAWEVERLALARKAFQRGSPSQ